MKPCNSVQTRLYDRVDYPLRKHAGQPVKQRVLIVDDEPSIRTLLALILGNQGGYSVRTAEDGASALQAIELEVPDILLADLQMPGMKGSDLMALVKQRHPKVKMVAMSGAPPEDRNPGVLPMDAFYLKDGSNWPELMRILLQVSLS